MSWRFPIEYHKFIIICWNKKRKKIDECKNWTCRENLKSDGRTISRLTIDRYKRVIISYGEDKRDRYKEKKNARKKNNIIDYPCNQDINTYIIGCKYFVEVWEEHLFALNVINFVIIFNDLTRRRRRKRKKKHREK